MKKLNIIIMMIVTASMLAGCDDGGTNEPTAAVGADEGSVYPNCCGVLIEQQVSGVSPTGGEYLWLALMLNDTLVSYGKPVYVPAGVYQGVKLTVAVSHLDELQAATYKKQVFASSTLDGVGDVTSRKITADANMVEIEDYSDDDCTPCCTKYLTRYIAYANKEFDDNAVGAGATIQTRYGSLCGEGTDLEDSATAQSGVWTGLRNDLPGSGVSTTDFAQCGYFRIRLVEPELFYDTTVYVEFSGIDFYGYALICDFHDDPDSWYYIPVPGNGSSHYYEIDITPSSGRLTFLYDGKLLYDTTGEYLKDLKFRYASWEGEINGRETDMPGIADNPCQIAGCSYRLSTSLNWYWVAFKADNDDIGVTPQSGERPDEWGIRINSSDSSTLEIWDVNPL